MEVSWKEHFYYDETSPSCLRWARAAANNRMQIGSIAGACTKGYYQIRVKVGQNLMNVRAHRVVWEMFNGVIPDGLQVDHKDRDVSNNKLENLRLVDNQANCQNQTKKKNNTSGVTGVHLKNTSTRPCWCAQWNDKGKRHQKSFSIKKHGFKEAFSMACQYRQSIIDTLNQNGMNYTEQHGK